MTFNIKDFPLDAEKPYGVEIKHPDDFLLDVFDLNPRLICKTCLAALTSYKRYPVTSIEFCDVLNKSGVPRFASTVYPVLDALY